MAQYWLMDQYAYSGLADHRQLALGVKAVHKTQYLDIENKYGREWYPVGEEFTQALSPAWSINIAQICFDQERVRDPNYRDEFIGRVHRRGKKWLDALQFDLLPWHEDDSMLPFLEDVKEKTGHTIILQAHSEAMSKLGPDALPVKLGKYAHALDYVLFDASHGKGVRMQPDALLPFLDASYDYHGLAGVGFGVAGGLCAEVVREELPALLEHHRDLSWDAEGRLHGTYEDGVPGLDWGKAKDYLEASHDVLYDLGAREV